MDKQKLRQVVVDNLTAVAPEVDPAVLKADQPLRNQVDLDSFDWLQFLLSLHEKLGIEIPESDYGQLTTLAGLLDYLHARLPG